MEVKSLLPKDGEALYYPHFFSPEESQNFYQILMSEILWKQEPIKIFGKLIMQPRLTAWYGDPTKTYRYSGIEMTPQPWTSTLEIIKSKIEKVSAVNFTSVLLNQYRNQTDSMGWHRDNEKELGKNPTIGSVSFGAPRTFRFRHYHDHKIKTEIELENGSFLLMRGASQNLWEHSVPKRSKVLDTRINLTFRKL